MVHLSKIYTRTGDGGTTGLGDGTRVPKTSPRVEACGAVDEVGASIGVALSLGGLDPARVALLRSVQNDLYDVGADLSVPEGAKPAAGGKPRLRVKAEQAARLEREIDAANAALAPLDSFVLPGGRPGAALLHLARTVSRRAERAVFRLAEDEPVNPQVGTYLNRLSDLLFVLARAENDGGRADVLWEPGRHRPAAGA
ncbi:MAG TPA: cob(I)yrinic acid a,c-diamide adenosyltransferase [Planctomycetota bacterium]|jgi:cob(I)alamin adenosyltransferase|nr:cob(I)yrinic acid a,c-diamide adenosyltransferase [Planctomycetota bacterium]